MHKEEHDDPVRRETISMGEIITEGVQIEKMGSQFRLMNRLIKLHNDRIVLYQRLQQGGLHIGARATEVLRNMIEEGKKDRQQLGRMLIAQGGEIDQQALKGTSRLLANANATEMDDSTLIALCESMEVLLLSIYDVILEAPRALTEEVKDLVGRQHRGLSKSLQMLRLLTA